MEATAAQQRSLRLRVASAVVAIPLLLGLTITGDVWYMAGVLVAALWAASEWLRLLERGGYHPFGLLALTAVTAIIVDAHLGGQAGAAIVAISALLGLIGVATRPEPREAIADWSLTLGGIVYTGVLLAYFILLRSLPNGAYWVITALLATFATDSAAFFIGRRFGTRRLAPTISPAKTVEGAVAGFIASILAYLVLAYGAGLVDNWLQAVAIGVVAGVATQIGDLAESAFKRSVRVKDASMTIPGHGGMLDRIDSLVFAGVVVYYSAQFLQVA